MIYQFRLFRGKKFNWYTYYLWSDISEAWLYFARIYGLKNVSMIEYVPDNPSFKMVIV